MGAPGSGPSGLSLEQDARLGVLTLAVQEVELVGDVAGAALVVGQDELERRIGSRKPPPCVQPRRQPEAEGVLSDAPGLYSRDLHQRPQARLRRPREGGE